MTEIEKDYLKINQEVVGWTIEKVEDDTEAFYLTLSKDDQRKRVKIHISIYASLMLGNVSQLKQISKDGEDLVYDSLSDMEDLIWQICESEIDARLVNFILCGKEYVGFSFNGKNHLICIDNLTHQRTFATMPWISEKQFRGYNPVALILASRNPEYLQKFIANRRLKDIEDNWQMFFDSKFESNEEEKEFFNKYFPYYCLPEKN
ncbi:MAG: hypothetical protein UT24_C0018G0016 [Candidatus Woesebacteria bacterium GW2011_GWB1_39_12]|uniref:Uncharacterized protein n=1 Tax=Candidatus Woesebacteria bacterium GW2011_GWB1_39_12 TaxID=1618574 RepID=A0A0G0M7A2_9BACT|nr:MAG: hypothetical protein UT24_C0018G0016 [Candidatus Woesebacteria bacterium GW2011_GWB1_39_12]